MRQATQQVAAFAAAVLLVASSLAGAVTIGVGGVDELDDINPIGESGAQTGAALGAGLPGVAIGSTIAEVFFGDTANATELEAADALEAEKNVYQGAITQGQNNQILEDSYNNYLQDTETVAKMVGKNAYIRALNNGTAEAEARQEAKDAVSDYYAAKQVQLLRTWSVSMTYTETLKEQLRTSNADPKTVQLNYTWDDVNSDNSVVTNVSYGATNETVLVNGTVREFDTAEVMWDNTNEPASGAAPLSPDPYHYQQYSNGGSAGYFGLIGDNLEVESLAAFPPEQNGEDIQGYDAESYLVISEYTTLWSEIENQNSQVQDEMDTFVTNTYDQYQAGEITEEDLVDPYLGARQYSPEADYNTWAIRSLTSMGVQPPANMSTTGTMNVTDHSTGQQLTGVLMSDGLPQSGSFEIGTRYDAKELQGYQFVVDDQGESTELTGNFTVTAVHHPNGTEKNITSVEYSSINYETTSIEEYKSTLEQLQETTAQINARQERMRQSGAGVGWLPNVGDFGGGFLAGGVAAFVVGAVIVVILLLTLYSVLGPVLMAT
ncbi:hypothetical protein [Halosimplex halophilum]|uniref:hypothetical protein n=1 Tax=Halosimplex halophilum TaxID=2559572 RepID=UPI00107F057D|nr:hypothetical protein [Halosimplex halophilum]